MTIKRVSIAEANGHLAELIEAAKRGDEIVIEGENDTIVKLVTLRASDKPRLLGLHRGMVEIRDDFNAPLSD